MENMINRYCIVRGTHSGVFAGTLVNHQGQEVELNNCRRIWYWDGAASISQLAVDGTVAPDNCKFTVSVEQIILTDIIEIIPCTENAERSIKGVPEWKR